MKYHYISCITGISIGVCVCVRMHVWHNLLCWKILLPCLVCVCSTVNATSFILILKLFQMLWDWGESNHFELEFKFSWKMNSQISILKVFWIEILPAWMNGAQRWHVLCNALWWKMWNDIDWNPSQCGYYRVYYFKKRKETKWKGTHKFQRELQMRIA